MTFQITTTVMLLHEKNTYSIDKQMPRSANYCLPCSENFLAEDILKYLLFCLENRLTHFMQIVGDNLHEMSKPIF